MKRYTQFDFDVIVVGAGHAGIEACLAASRLGMKTLMVTSNISRIGYMSCNPSIGGLAKGHMVREIDLLGGQMGLVADRTCIQFKRLNASKGPAVRGSRTQNDKVLYAQQMSEALHSQENLSLLEAEVKSLILSSCAEGSAASLCEGVVLNDGSRVRAKSVIVTTGTFMNGMMHVGLVQSPGGRVGDASTIGLSDQLREHGFSVKRLKTGTPARLHKDSIDWSKTIEQYGDQNFFPFSLRSLQKYALPQIACYLSRTTEKTHEIIRQNLDKSPMFCGLIEGSGPRYCPSIEDKITRFADRDSHQTFLEPESLSTPLIYLQGISTSLPEAVQDEFLKTIPGLENVKVIRYGYAVEYDFIEPTQIFHRLETRQIRNLFLAGQINGTSGYEEAAAQGFIAGVNAAFKISDREEFILDRDKAYMGVLIDDLVTKGTREPYRMFTSRAEHRLVLREDNTLDRLIDISGSIGLMPPSALETMIELREKRRLLFQGLKDFKVYPNAETQKKLDLLKTSKLLKSVSAEELMRRPEMSWEAMSFLGYKNDFDPLVNEAVEIEVKYAGYIRRQEELIQQASVAASLKLPESLDYTRIKGLSSEEVQKLSGVRPRTLGQAQRISGVNPSAIQAIMIYLKGIQNLNRVKDSQSERSIDQLNSVVSSNPIVSMESAGVVS